MRDYLIRFLPPTGGVKQIVYTGVAGTGPGF